MATLVNRNVWVFAAVLGLSGAGCADLAEEGASEHALAAGLSTDKASYVANEQVQVTFSGMSGASSDWIAIAHAGDPDTAYTAFSYTGGGTDGTLTFAPLAPGSYEARAYYDWDNTASYMVQARATFTVTAQPAGVTAAPSAPSYTPNSPVIINYTGLTGTSTDWVAIAVPGSAPTDFVRFSYTNGSPSGSVEFGAGLPAGSYVARTFNEDSFTVAAQSVEFAVGNIVSTSMATYAPNAAISVHFQGIPASSLNWIGIAQQGAPASSVIAFQYVSTASGDVTFNGLSTGIYEARIYLNDSFTVHASSTFSVAGVTTPDIQTSAASYVQGEQVHTTYAFSGNVRDWVGIAAAGSPDTSFISYVYVNGAGTADFSSIGYAPGNYEARLYSDDGYTVAARTAFTVTAPVVAAADVSTTSATYTVGQSVLVNFANLGASGDWVSVALAGSPDTAFVQYVYTSGASGQVAFDGLAAGSYEVRAYRGESFVVADRATFDVQ